MHGHQYWRMIQLTIDWYTYSIIFIMYHLYSICDMMRGRQPTPTREYLIAAHHSSLSSISVCISEALLSPVALLRVPRKVACGLPLVLVPWEHSQMMSSLIVSSGCCTQCPVGLIRLCLILFDSLGRLSYKSKFLKWSSHETISATLSVHV